MVIVTIKDKFVGQKQSYKLDFYTMILTLLKQLQNHYLCTSWFPILWVKTLAFEIQPIH